MSLHHQLIQAGHWLFRQRGRLPWLYLPLLLPALWHPTPAALVWSQGPGWGLALSCALLGLALRFYSVGCAPLGTSGRNTQAQQASTLNTTGAYAVVRHPLYLANGLLWLAPALLTGSLYLTLLTLASTLLFYERIILAEEAFLASSFGTAFRAWADQTPALLPRLRQWTPPALPFSWKRALARENATLLSSNVTAALLWGLVGSRDTPSAPPWVGVLLWMGCALLFYGVVRWLRKRGRLEDQAPLQT